ncbi:MAG: deoxyhypusine synthase [Fervidicoccaceae archaeon]
MNEDIKEEKVIEALLKEKIDDTPPQDEELRLLCRVLLPYYGRVHGFMAGHLFRASRILREGLMNSRTRIFSFTGNIVSTGLRGLIAKVIRDGFFNLVVTTTGTIDHDIAKSTGPGYYKGDFRLDDVFLEKIGIHRLGNVLIPKENYGPVVEKVVRDVLEELKNKTISGHELLWIVGQRISDNNSILRASWERRVPIIVPGFYDGSFGTNVHIYSKLNNVKLDLSLDQSLMEDIFFSEKNTPIAALIVGGGISKHHVIWWSQFAGGLDYAVYVTTAVEYDGSLSGAHPREAISWGKIKPEASSEVVYGDATIILPLLLSSLYCE